MQTATQAVSRVLTVAKEQPTTGRPVNIEAWAKWAEFETLGDPQLENMVKAVARFVLDMREGKKPRWLSLVGTSGAGKTYLAKRVWRWFRDSSLFETTVTGKGEPIYPGQSCHWPNLADQLKANTGYEVYDELKRERFVVLDDIGQNRDTSGHTTEKLSILLSCRVGKWTLITSNLSLEQIADKIDPRIASRMLRDGGEVVDVNVPDFNLRQKGS